MRTDTERLDWLAAHNEFDIWGSAAWDSSGKVRIALNDNHGPNESGLFTGNTLREAIDAAMDAEKPQPIAGSPESSGGV